mgnify:FL=1
MKRYTHLQPGELCKISVLHARGLSSSAIADELKRHVSTVRRELKRSPLRYDETVALAHRARARRLCADNARRFNAEHWARVERALCLHYSPEQIVGRAWVLGEPRLPSRSRIYSWLSERTASDEHFLHGKRVRRYGSRAARAKRPNPSAWAARATSIHQRPEAINLRQQFGHWEIDTVEGRKRDLPRLLGALERMSLYLKLNKIKHNRASAVLSCLRHWRAGRRDVFLSLTPDQGVEFAHLERFLPNTHIFVCDPHSPGQKGAMENTNGLVRFYVPKGFPISLIDPEYVQYIQDMLNDRPRKSLDFLTPREVASFLYPAGAL